VPGPADPLQDEALAAEEARADALVPLDLERAGVLAAEERAALGDQALPGGQPDVEDLAREARAERHAPRAALGGEEVEEDALAGDSAGQRAAERSQQPALSLRHRSVEVDVGIHPDHAAGLGEHALAVRQRDLHT